MPPRMRIAATALALLAAAPAIGQVAGGAAKAAKPQAAAPDLLQLAIARIAPRLTGPPRPRTFAVPSLATPGQRANFASRVSEVCRTPFAVTETLEPSNQPSGTMIGESRPPLGSVIHCGDTVAVTLSSGSAPAPSDATKGSPTTPSLAQPPPTDLAKPAAPPTAEVPHEDAAAPVNVPAPASVAKVAPEHTRSGSDAGGFIAPKPWREPEPQRRPRQWLGLFGSSLLPWMAAVILLAAVAATTLGLRALARRAEHRRVAQLPTILVHGATAIASPPPHLPAIVLERGPTAVTVVPPPRLVVKVTADV